MRWLGIGWVLLALACSSSTKNEGTPGTGGAAGGGATGTFCANAGGETNGGGSTIQSFVSPSNKRGSLSLAGSFDATIASDPPGKAIYYTTDGTPPGPNGPSGTSPVPIEITTNTLLKWTVDGETAVHQMCYELDASVGDKRGQLVEHVALAPNSSPILAVTPGQAASGMADWQQWTSSECPGCQQLLIFGFAQTLGCIAELPGLHPGPYPGATGVGAAFDLVAPAAPANYRLHARAIEELQCQNAISKSTALDDGDMEIALIIVRQ